MRKLPVNADLNGIAKISYQDFALVIFVIAQVRILHRQGRKISYAKIFRDFRETFGVPEELLPYKKAFDRFVYYGSQVGVSEGMVEQVDIHDQVLRFIEVTRSSFIGAVTVFTNGSCYQFHRMLKIAFPDVKVEPRIDHSGHVVSKIAGRLYDITGQVEGSFHELDELQEQRLEREKFVVQVEKQEA